MNAVLKIVSGLFGGLKTIDKLLERHDKYKAQKFSNKESDFLKRYDSTAWPE